MRSERLRNGAWELLSRFSYDYRLPVTGRVAIGTISGMESQTSDAVSLRTTSFTYSPAWQVIGSSTLSQGLLTGLTSFGFDPAGNRTSEESDGVAATAEYDAENRLVEIRRRLDQPTIEDLAANQQKARALAREQAPAQPERKDQ
jgi:hypothetical protein